MTGSVPERQPGSVPERQPGSVPERQTGSVPERQAGFVPPPYPHDQLDALKRIAAAAPGGLVDASVGTPVDPMPEVAVRALIDAAAGATGYPATIGSEAYRAAAAGWIERRFGCAVTTDEVVVCIGTKELVASLPRALSLRDPSRDTVLFPAASYPTYAMGATLAGLRAVPVPVDDDWHPDLGAVDDADAERALVLWLNDPSNPTGVTASADAMRASVAWARERGIIVASDECYAEFTYDDSGAPRPGHRAVRRQRRRARGAFVVEAVEHGGLACGLRRR